MNDLSKLFGAAGSSAGKSKPSNVFGMDDELDDDTMYLPEGKSNITSTGEDDYEPGEEDENALDLNTDEAEGDEEITSELEAAVLNRAVDLGAIDIVALHREFPHLTEAIKTIRVRVDRKSKIAALTKSTALTMARQTKDPLYARYQKTRTILRSLKQAIFKKYGRNASKKALNIIRGVDKSGVVKLDK